ncbi:Gamma-glutamyltranspeptidase (EC @ Glutathione hydrolase (EC [Olavius algarvensis associated proteobacterium Delta 3]|nr:Gamma-glutamyltranspeptidase (EC @ Glutathione hydrolase (EC [Olavius algarvensis associated proteobacterium Delta 3]CAB5104326.1 Gamma-glutamyltranspeptidase (EC @ Glutathione hydrolase (EC [Olavius algarvensis associated proteobacterium Delta 3]
MNRKWGHVILSATMLIVIAAVTAPVPAQETAIISQRDIFHPVIGRDGMVATQQQYASDAGLQVLKEGGNAVDAAVTIGFTLAVTLPRAGNIGGGGFMLIHSARSGETVALDYREKAPMNATRDMFLDEQGDADPEKSRYSYLAAGVPGTVAGMTMALEKYGTISLKRALQPAIRYAEKGFPVDAGFRESLIAAKERMQASDASMKIFFKKGGQPYDVGELFIQKDLAQTLKLIARKGRDAFYKGDIADKIVAVMQDNGGLITKEDLAKYSPALRKPIHGAYRGYDIYSMPPPSSGGVHIVQILNILEAYPISFLGHNTAATLHLMAEAMKLAYADRSKHLGDSDFVPVPVKGLISKSYADALRGQIDQYRATPSNTVLPGEPGKFESNDTTHFSVLDRNGNAVSNTFTINFSYGSKLTVPGAGFLLNNEMDDFSAKPGVPNAYGLIGGEFNAVQPEKRMLSSMSPTIVTKDGRPFLITGSPGGSRIITTTLQVIMNVIDHGMNIAAATNAVRIHHQWLPDEIRIENGLNPDTIGLLRQRGHKVVVKDAMGSTQSIMRHDGVLFGASDPRRTGALTLGF